MKKILSKITVLICMIRLRATALHEIIFITAMLNPSLKSRFMEKFSRFSRILTGLVGYKISPLENKKRSKNKNVKKRVFYKNNKKRKKRVLHLWFQQHLRVYTRQKRSARGSKKSSGVHVAWVSAPGNKT